VSIEPGGPVRSDARSADSGRAAFAISQVYYYAAAVVGVGFLIGGGISALIAVRRLALPGEFDSSRSAVRSILEGLAFAIPGLALTAWHVRQARRREGRVMPAVFWGASLYYHLVALLSVLTVFGGAVAGLAALVDLVRPSCFESGPYPAPVFVPGLDACYPPHATAWRSLMDALIVILVAGGIWVWHLRRGSRLGTGATAPAATG
jgi:hypothetical protein